MSDDDNKPFLPDHVDEQVDHYLARHDNKSAIQLTQALQRYYISCKDHSPSLERVWNRLQEHRAYLNHMQLQASHHNEQQQVSSIQQVRRHQMKKARLSSQDENAAPGRLAMVATVVFLMLLVGSAVAVFQFAREGHSETGTGICTTVGSGTGNVDHASVYALVNNTLYRLDATTHKTLWNFHMLPIAGNVYTDMPGQVVGGTYYLLGTDTDGYYLYALNTSNGTVRWRVKLHDTPQLGVTANPLIANGTIYLSEASIADGYSEITAFHAATGKVVWQHHYTGTGTATGEKNITDFATGLQLQAATSVMLYSTNFTRKQGIATLTLSAVSIKDGSPVWQTTTKTDEQAIGGQVVDGVLYLSTTFTGTASHSFGQVFAYNATKGTQQWSSKQLTGQPSTPVIDNGIIYLGTVTDLNATGGNVYALRASNGSQLWRYAAQGGASTPSIENGIAYIDVSSYNGSQHAATAINGITGAACWSHSLPGHTTSMSPLAVSKNFIYLSTSTSEVVVLNLSDGSQVSIFTIGKSPTPTGPDDHIQLTVAS